MSGEPEPLLVGPFHSARKTAEVLASGCVQNGAVGTVSAKDGRHPGPGGLKHDLWCILFGLEIDILYNGFLGWVFCINENMNIVYIFIYMICI